MSSQARILLFDHTAKLGGGEIALLNLVKQIDRSRFHPVVLCCEQGPLIERLQGEAETYVLPLGASVTGAKKDALGIATLLRLGEILQFVTYIFRLARFMRQNNIDLLHTNSLKADVMGGFAALLVRKPALWHVRDRIDSDYLPAPVVRIFRWLCRWIPAYVVANSAATLDTIRLQGANRKTLPAGAPAASVVHDGIDASTIAPAEHVAHGPVKLGLIGRISPWKGQHIFIKAASEVRKRFPDVRFIIIGAALFGEHAYEQELRELVHTLHLENIVEFAGFRTDVQQAIAELDVVVHASTTGEPFGQVIIEGMAAAKPVIATRGGGVPEIVEHEDTGFLVPMGDVRGMARAMCQLLSDPVRAAQMGRRGRQRVEQCFTIQQTARKIQAVYCKLLGKAFAELTSCDMTAAEVSHLT